MTFEKNGKIVIKEDPISRNWLSKRIFQSGLNVASKWWHFSLATIILVVPSMHFMAIHKKAWPIILLIPSFPMKIALSCIAASPFFTMPQRWMLTQRHIKAREIRVMGSIRWSSVCDWKLDHMSGLPNYYRIYHRRFRLNRLKTILRNTAIANKRLNVTPQGAQHS